MAVNAHIIKLSFCFTDIYSYVSTPLLQFYFIFVRNLLLADSFTHVQIARFVPYNLKFSIVVMAVIADIQNKISRVHIA